MAARSKAQRSCRTVYEVVCNDNGVTIMMISAATCEGGTSIQGLDSIGRVWEQRQ